MFFLAEIATPACSKSSWRRFGGDAIRVLVWETLSVGYNNGIARGFSAIRFCPFLHG